MKLLASLGVLAAAIKAVVEYLRELARKKAIEKDINDNSATVDGMFNTDNTEGNETDTK